MENLEKLIRELVTLDDETQWVEFKHNNYDPLMIGEDISALANGATLQDRENAYFLWGINDETHEIVGTSYNLQNLKKGNQELESWLRNLLSPHADFEYDLVAIDGKYVGVMTIAAASGLPVAFEKQEYIRVGSYTKPLKNYPALQAKLWNKLQNKVFEDQISKKDLPLNDAVSLLDIDVYYDKTQMARPSTVEGVVNSLLEDGLLIAQDNGLYSITNLGAVLFAKRMKDFPKVVRKSPRVVMYKDNTRVDILKQREFDRGYAVVFEELMQYINALLPSEEVFEDGIRRKIEYYPEIAIREIVANALIHQDFSVTGAGPLIEILEDRIETSNPGRPLIDVFRIIDSPPRSRNEKLSALIRRMGMCEELGSGWDRIAIACEKKYLPAPRMDIYEESTRVALYKQADYSSLTTDDRLWACYLHACVQFIQRDYLTNASFRARFGLKDSSSAAVSRIIKEAVDKKLIRPFDPNTAPRYMKYVPIWG
ncbi:MAG: putative DNA binding domain-containing protein [Eubacterium sp.]|nr:putative DNA binding domain-containing protein [Eubacterium sp.]